MKKIPVGLAVCVSLTASFFICSLFMESIRMAECPVFKYTGLYCPACGATRAVDAFLKGKFIESLKQNPLFIYCGFSFWTYAICELISLNSSEMEKALKHIIKFFIIIGICIAFLHVFLHNKWPVTFFI